MNYILYTLFYFDQSNVKLHLSTAINEDIDELYKYLTFLVSLSKILYKRLKMIRTKDMNMLKFRDKLPTELLHA